MVAGLRSCRQCQSLSQGNVAGVVRCLECGLPTSIPRVWEMKCVHCDLIQTAADKCAGCGKKTSGKPAKPAEPIKLAQMPAKKK